MPGPRLLALLSTGLLLVAACEGDNEDVTPRPTPVAIPTASDSRVVALVGTMSGRDAWRGEDAFEGAHLAVHELNRARRPGSRDFELLTFDDRGDAERATELVERLARSDRTVGIVYAGPPEGLPPAEDELSLSGVAAIACYGDLYGARLLAPHLFQVSPSLVWEARRIASYLVRDRRYLRIGLLASRSLTGTTAVRALRSALADAGGNGPVVVRYDLGSDARESLQRLRSQRVEAVVVEASPPDLDSLMETLPDLNAEYRRTNYARIASAPPSVRATRRRSGWWHPQIVSFDLAISPRIRHTPLPGTVAAETYARGAHYLPIPNLQRFRKAFLEWWGIDPLGWEQRAYDAVRMIGWALEHRRGSEDLALALERMRGVRLGALDITLGPDDHTSVTQSTVGLWVVPGSGAEVPERNRLPAALPWVPLARGFSIDGARTDVLPEDWKHLFRGSTPVEGRAPRYARSRVGVATPRSDPVH